MLTIILCEVSFVLMGRNQPIADSVRVSHAKKIFIHEGIDPNGCDLHLFMSHSGGRLKLSNFIKRINSPGIIGRDDQGRSH